MQPGEQERREPLEPTDEDGDAVDPVLCVRGAGGLADRELPDVARDFGRVIEESFEARAGLGAV